MYKYIPILIKDYAREGLQDQFAVNDFMTCENNEAVSGLRNELTGIVQGDVPEETLAAAIGAGRKLRFGSYKDWARLALVWMASYKG